MDTHKVSDAGILKTGQVEQATKPKQRGLPWSISTLIAMIVVATLAASWAAWRFGSLGTAIRYAQGDRLMVDATTKSFGVAVTNTETSVTFQLTNWSTEAIRIVGGSTVCVCTIPDNLPFSVDPGEVKDFRVRIKTREKPKGFSYPLTIFTNIAGQQRIELMIIGEIVAPPA